MEARATAKHVRMGPRKVRFVMDTIRGKYTDDALNSLKFIPNYAADEIANVIKSAIANAENNHGMDTTHLKVARCYVDVGPTAKRVQPRAQGRAYRILKRSSHITVIVAEAEAPPVTGKREADIKKRGKKPPLQAPLPGAAAVETAPVEEVMETAPIEPMETVEERDALTADETSATPVAADTTVTASATDSATDAPTENVVAEENAMGSDETTPLPSDLPTGQPQEEAAVDAAAGTGKE